MKRATVVGTLVGLGFSLGLFIGWQLVGRAQTPPNHFVVTATEGSQNGAFPPAVWVLNTESGDLKAYQLFMGKGGGVASLMGPLSTLK